MKNNINNLLFSILISITTVLSCLFFDINFFFVDDAQNEFLPFLREIGRGWLGGEIPFILKDTFIGSNTMIDIYRAIFLPQNIVLSILSVKINSLIVLSSISAIINLTIMSFSSIKLVEALNRPKKFGIILALLFVINPIFLYVYLGSWWNGAEGQAWFVASLASLFFLRNNFSVKLLTAQFFCVFCVFASGWPHSAISYVVIALAFLLERIYNKKIKEALCFTIVSISSALTIFPIYSEYIFSFDLISRSSAFGNYDNFLSIPLNQMIFSFNPVYYHFMHWFGGYKLILIPLGYTSILTLISLCFIDFRKVSKDKTINFIIVLSILFFILTQTPSSLGPIRWPFRFYPYFAECIILLSLYILSYKGSVKITKNRVIIFLTIIIVSSILSVFSQTESFGKIVLLQLIFLAATLIYLWQFIKTKCLSLFSTVIYSFLCLFLMLFIQPSIIGYVTMPWLKNDIHYDNNFSRGYLLSLTNGREPKEHIEDLNSAQFLLYDLKAINGASPVGNNKISQLLSTHSSQAYFNVEETINSLSNKFNNNCYFSLLNIDTIILNREQNNAELSEKLYSCGFIKKDVNNQVVDYFVNPDYIYRGNISYLSESIMLNTVLQQKYNIETYNVSSNGNGGYVIFSRVYWHGYKLFLNGKEVPIDMEKGLLKAYLPGGLDNAILELNYFPSSWKYSLPISLFGLFLFIITLCFNRKLFYAK